MCPVSRLFQSTPSVWRATSIIPSALCTVAISIHALRVEGDAGWHITGQPILRISIHALRVEGDRYSSD